MVKMDALQRLLLGANLIPEESTQWVGMSWELCCLLALKWTLDIQNFLVIFYPTLLSKIEDGLMR